MGLLMSACIATVVDDRKDEAKTNSRVVDNPHLCKNSFSKEFHLKLTPLCWVVRATFSDNAFVVMILTGCVVCLRFTSFHCNSLVLFHMVQWHNWQLLQRGQVLQSLAQLGRRR